MTSLLAEPTATSSGTLGPRRRRPGRIWTALLLVAALLLAREVHHVLLGANIHALAPGRIYRGAQPTRASMDGLVKDYGIRTVINLRGYNGASDWYLEEARACQGLGVALEDVTLSAGRLPNAGEIKRLVEILDRAEYPIFLHCRRGADRTGLAAALTLLLQTDTTVVQARAAMSWRHGHIALGRPAYLDEFFDLYEGWLAGQDRAHDQGAFRHWLLHEYQGGWLRYRFEEWRPLQSQLKLGQPSIFEVAVKNLSDRPWRITPFSTAGVHLWWRLFDADERELYQDRGPLRDQTVAPGGVLRTSIVLPSMPRPGRYRLVVDMIEEHHCTFLQAGAEPHEEELHVRD